MRLAVHRTWKERFRDFYSAFFPNASLKHFPPDFTLRDPVLSLVNRHRKQGKSCGLILLHLEDFHQLFAVGGLTKTQSLQQMIRETILEILPEFFQEHEVIGVKQFRWDDFCLFIKDSEQLSFEDFTDKSARMRKELELKLRKSPLQKQGVSLHFQVGFHMLADEIESTQAAVLKAFHYAQSIASKRLPTSISLSRKDLLSILDTEGITVLAQPIISLKDGSVFGWELLTRGPVNSPYHRPSELFEHAYQADLLSPMEFLVIKKAFQEMSKREIREQVFINVTPVSLLNPFFLDLLLDNLRMYPQIKATQIVLEITERHIIRDFRHISSMMEEYRIHGFRFAVDDAGAGYSSLQTITELIPDIIKIDKSMIQDIDQITVKQSLLKALVHFAENINCKVIAEGIERKEEAELLTSMNVQMGQGFYFGRPAPLQVDRDRVKQYNQVSV